MSRVPYIPTTLTVDSYDTRALGLVIDRAPLIRDVTGLDLPTTAVADLDGLVATETATRAAERRFTLGGTLMASSLATLQANYRALQYRVAGGPRTLVLVDDSTRRISAWLSGLTFAYLGRDLGSEFASVELAWRALTPFWESTSATTVALTTTPAACALGTVPSWPVITVDQNCVVTYKDDAAATVASITITGISGSQTVSIDMETRAVTHSVSGITPALRTAGRFFALSPYDGDYPTSAWPTLQVSTGTGSVTYRKRWWG